MKKMIILLVTCVSYSAFPYPFQAQKKVNVLIEMHIDDIKEQCFAEFDGYTEAMVASFVNSHAPDELKAVDIAIFTEDSNITKRMHIRSCIRESLDDLLEDALGTRR